MINHITALETLAAQLVDELTAVKQLVNEHYESQAEQQEPTPNEQRKVITEKAKQFVESAIERGRDSDARKGDVGNETYKEYFYTIEFFTKENKVTALVTRTNREGEKLKRHPDHVGRAKCMPGDVFNEYIGKAIALGRALELDVSEFENAVQPTTPVVGMKALVNGLGWNYISTIQKLKTSEYSNSIVWILANPQHVIKLIDDTNAQY